MEDISHGLECQPIQCEMASSAELPAQFRYVKRNIPGPSSNREQFEEQLSGCNCRQECCPQSCSCLKRFGPNYHPTTRQLISDAVISSHLKPILECNSQCGCKATCSNRLVQHGPRVKLKVAPSGVKGFGLFVREDVKQLSFVCEYAGEIVNTIEARKRLLRRGGGMNYLIVLREHCSTGVVLTCVDPEFMGSVGRFANHSCDPNLLMVPVRVDNSIPKLALFARRHIVAGEELTFDYSGETVLCLPASPDVCAARVSENIAEKQSSNILQRTKKCNASLHELKKTGTISNSLDESTTDFTDESCKKDNFCDFSRRLKTDINVDHDISTHLETLPSGESLSVCGESATRKRRIDVVKNRPVPSDEGSDELCQTDSSHLYQFSNTISCCSPSTVVPEKSNMKQSSLPHSAASSLHQVFKEQTDKKEKTSEQDFSFQVHPQNGDQVHLQYGDQVHPQNGDQLSVSWNDHLPSPNTQERTFACRTAETSQTVAGEPQIKCLKLTEIEAVRKTCFCGSSQCKGDLPFESAIFSTN